MRDNFQTKKNMEKDIRKRKNNLYRELIVLEEKVTKLNNPPNFSTHIKLLNCHNNPHEFRN